MNLNFVSVPVNSDWYLFQVVVTCMVSTLVLSILYNLNLFLNVFSVSEPFENRNYNYKIKKNRISQNS